MTSAENSLVRERADKMSVWQCHRLVKFGITGSHFTLGSWFCGNGRLFSGRMELATGYTHLPRGIKTNKENQSRLTII